MQTLIETTYQLSPRVTLTPGDQFTVSGGPYYRSADGTKVPLAARGRLTFIAVHRTGARVLVEARDGGGTVMLHLAGRRRSPVPGSWRGTTKFDGESRVDSPRDDARLCGRSTERHPERRRRDDDHREPDQ